MKRFSIPWHSIGAGVLCVASLMTGAAPPARAQTASTTQEQQRKTSTPYSGDLSIFDYPDRDKKLHINQMMDLLGIAPGKSVADIGAGSGWFTVRAAQRVTPTGKVFAVDINPEAIRYVQERTQKEKLTNIKTVLGTGDDPRLPPNSVDAVLLLKTYHEVAKPVELLRNLRSALRADARVGIVDRNGNGENHGVQKSVVIQEVESAGYRLLGEHDELVKDDRMDYFLIFVAK
ncbi:MAG: class I SAM-dependent methyltransferase [Candidatus Korobacteraceae bacterium]